MSQFRDVMIKGGAYCTIRESRGDDSMAACGQLGDLSQSVKPAPMLRPPERFRDMIVPDLV